MSNSSKGTPSWIYEPVCFTKFLIYRKQHYLWFAFHVCHHCVRFFFEFFWYFSAMPYILARFIREFIFCRLLNVFCVRSQHHRLTSSLNSRHSCAYVYEKGLKFELSRMSGWIDFLKLGQVITSWIVMELQLALISSSLAVAIPFLSYDLFMWIL